MSLAKVRLLAVVLASLVVFASEASEVRKVAVFARNLSSQRSLDAQVPGLRDRLASVFANQKDISVVGVGENLGNGTELTPNLIRTLQCDYVALAGIASAGSMVRRIGEGGTASTVYTLRMTLKIMDATGKSIDALPNWMKRYPVLESTGDAEAYYDILFDQWLQEVESMLGAKCPSWPVVRQELPRPPVASGDKGGEQKPVVVTVSPQPVPQPVQEPMVSFRISTTIDQVVSELESQTRGVNGEMLAELRKVVGGATVEIDDVVEGSCPGEFMATPGLHRLKIVRAWMKPYMATIRVKEGMKLNVAMEMDDEGIQKWGSLESLRADVAKRYAEAAMTRGVKVNVDTAHWRDVGDGRVNLPSSK